jgi:integrase
MSADVAGYAGTRRKAHAAMSQFCKHLVRRRVLETNPMRQIDAPRPGAPRCQYLDVPTMIQLAERQPEPYQTLSILLGGTGIELSVALALHARDVDLVRKEIRAAGTKTHARDRIVRVAEWAWPSVLARVAGLDPNAPLFPNTDRWRSRDEHHAACEKLGIQNYRLADQRHSFTVRAARAGTPAELIARQLGHANAVLVLKVYGRFMPSQQDRDRWELLAAAKDAEAAKLPAGSGGSDVYHHVYHADEPQDSKSRKPMGPRDLESSRGGTRTRDPGIMSAVL